MLGLRLRWLTWVEDTELDGGYGWIGGRGGGLEVAGGNFDVDGAHLVGAGVWRKEWRRIEMRQERGHVTEKCFFSRFLCNAKLLARRKSELSATYRIAFKVSSATWEEEEGGGGGGKEEERKVR